MATLSSNVRHPVAELRGLLARSFADGIAEAAPRVGAAVKAQVGRCPSGAKRSSLDYVARLLSSEHGQLADHIDHYLRQRFDDKLASPEDSMSHSGKFSVEALKLFEELDMLEEVEREQCVNRLRDCCRRELYGLAPYLRTLLGPACLREARNPVFPRVLLCAFTDALEDLGCDADARRTAFRAYDPLLDRIISDVYARLGALLAEAADGAPANRVAEHAH